MLQADVGADNRSTGSRVECTPRGQREPRIELQKSPFVQGVDRSALAVRRNHPSSMRPNAEPPGKLGILTCQRSGLGRSILAVEVTCRSA